MSMDQSKVNETKLRVSTQMKAKDWMMTAITDLALR